MVAVVAPPDADVVPVVGDNADVVVLAAVDAVVVKSPDAAALDKQIKKAKV